MLQQDNYGEYAPSPSPGPQRAAQPIRRTKTIRDVNLYAGNFVLDCPVPPRLLSQIDHAATGRDEFTHMRYQAATCDPEQFVAQRFTLRQKLFTKQRPVELFIVITMYNEPDELLARTLIGVFQNIEIMNKKTNSKTWGEEAWKKILVCIVSDGVEKIHARTRALLAALGVYQEGIAKTTINKKDSRGNQYAEYATAHIYEVREILKYIPSELL
jgi:chitin synthase